MQGEDQGRRRSSPIADPATHDHEEHHRRQQMQPDVDGVESKRSRTGEQPVQRIRRRRNGAVETIPPSTRPVGRCPDFCEVERFYRGVPFDDGVVVERKGVLQTVRVDRSPDDQNQQRCTNRGGHRPELLMERTGRSRERDTTEVIRRVELEMVGPAW